MHGNEFCAYFYTCAQAHLCVWSIIIYVIHFIHTYLMMIRIGEGFTVKRQFFFSFLSLLYIYPKKMAPNARKLWLHQSHCTVQRIIQRKISVFQVQTPLSYTAPKTHLHWERAKKNRRRKMKIRKNTILCVLDLDCETYPAELCSVIMITHTRIQ